MIGTLAGAPFDGTEGNDVPSVFPERDLPEGMKDRNMQIIHEIVGVLAILPITHYLCM